jgi:protein-disulfide isomerase-like protein with CxxC motif
LSAADTVALAAIEYFSCPINLSFASFVRQARTSSPPEKTMKEQQLHDLILQSLEHELGGVKVYTTAVRCALNDDLKREWRKYLEQTQSHVAILTGVCEAFGLDPMQQVPSREIVRTVGEALVAAMEMAQRSGNREAAEIVACEAVVLAETKDHLDWELLGKCAEKIKGPKGKALQQACEQVEDQEDEHLYHTKGWCRELWIQSLGMVPVLPPPEEQHDVKTAIGAARAEKAAEKMR